MPNELTADRLRELLHYNPITGIFTWAEKVSDKVRVGVRAGRCTGRLAYRVIGLLGERYAEHRLAVLHVTGAWPALEVDHINGEPSDNRWSNLRECSHAENHQNRKTPSHNTTGIAGVSWHKLRQKWRSTVTLDGKQHHLGLFDTKEEAQRTRLLAKASFHTFQPIQRQ